MSGECQGTWSGECAAQGEEAVAVQYCEKSDFVPA